MSAGIRVGRPIVIALGVLIPVVVSVSTLVAAVRIVDTGHRVHEAAVRAVSVAASASDRSGAADAARGSAAGFLAATAPGCRDVAVAVQATHWQPGDEIRLRVYCTVSTTGVAVLPIPRRWTLTATATAFLPFTPQPSGGQR